MKVYAEHRLDCGMSLIELMVVIVIIGIGASIAMTTLVVNLDDARRTRTEQEMDRVLSAIAGDPNRSEGGIRCDFGYVGDVGAFPPNLTALTTNPGLATWNGPYLSSDWAEDAQSFLHDEWGAPYVYSGGTVLVSTGGGSPISKRLTGVASDYLLNFVRGSIVDAADDPPGIVYADSVTIEISFPDGSGAVSTRRTYPAPDGQFELDSLPIGRHPLTITFEPANDTLFRYLTVVPGHRSSIALTYAFGTAQFSAFPAFSPGGVVPNSERGQS
jgi:prepilin-type N-terminal cleavage/methylation domain-containing protein